MNLSLCTSLRLNYYRSCLMYIHAQAMNSLPRTRSRLERMDPSSEVETTVNNPFCKADMLKMISTTFLRGHMRDMLLADQG